MASGHHHHSGLGFATGCFAPRSTAITRAAKDGWCTCPEIAEGDAIRVSSDFQFLGRERYCTGEEGLFGHTHHPAETVSTCFAESMACRLGLIRPRRHDSYLPEPRLFYCPLGRVHWCFSIISGQQFQVEAVSASPRPMYPPQRWRLQERVPRHLIRCQNLIAGPRG